MNPERDAELEQEVEKPPVLTYRDGRSAKGLAEPQLLVGWVDYSKSGLSPHVQAQRLRDLGICLDLARYDEESFRWEQVLFSEEVADMLVEMAEEGALPFTFEAGPSRGGLCVLWDRQEGRTAERPPLKLRAYVQPARAEELDVLAKGGSEDQTDSDARADAPKED